MRSEPIVFLFVVALAFSISFFGLIFGLIAIIAQLDWRLLTIGFIACITTVTATGGYMLVKRSDRRKPEVDAMQPDEHWFEEPLAINQEIDQVDNHQAPSFANYQQLRSLMAAHQLRYTKAAYSRPPHLQRNPDHQRTISAD